MRILQRAQKRDPFFLRKVYVAHYCSIPFHLLDYKTKVALDKQGIYPTILIEELYAASFHLVRNFELAPFANDTSLEDLISAHIDAGKL